jgi:hypothetical protein
MVMLSKKIRLLRGDLHALSLVMHALTTHALPAGQEKSKIRANVSLRAQLAHSQAALSLGLPYLTSLVFGSQSRTCYHVRRSSHTGVCARKDPVYRGSQRGGFKEIGTAGER